MSRRERSRSLWILALLVCFVMGGVAHPIKAQEIDVLDPIEDLDFDDPEAWAMKFFTSVSLLTGIGSATEHTGGEVALGLEVLSVPHLDREQRTVGFGGFKEEDLNRTPAWARLRGEIGLGSGWGLVVGWVPPVKVDGVEADLWSLGLEKVLWRGDRWGLGLRAYGQTGDVQGDFTCTEGGDELFPPGSPENPFGCESPSSDQITMDYLGAELVVTYSPLGGKNGRTPEIHGGISFNHLDMEFQVDAETFGFRDRSLLRADGDAMGFAAGATWQIGSKGSLGGEIFYSPLDVRRSGEQVESDDLLHLRLLWRWRVR
ncbi:MAG: hypothetical protein MPN21_17385 [Thermoanaerobaculia bacterium]|nr:hypothetical protein [Thermoanaerobaculia bacterium]